MQKKNTFSKKALGLAVVLSLSLTYLSSCKKDSVVTPVNDDSISIKKDLLAATDVVSAQGYNIENSLPRGYVKNGSVDYTSYVQAAITKYSSVTFPAFPILVNDKGLKIGSNKTLTFLSGSEIRLKRSSKARYNIFNIDRVSNVKLINPVIRGDRDTHIGTSGEHGMGIGVYSSSNIVITNAKIYDCWGDGIYLGRAGSTGAVNYRITITNAYLRNNRRDGISIIAVNGLKLIDTYAGYTNGTRPSCGINFEPNSPADEIKDVTVTNPVTEYNDGSGIQIGINKLLQAGSKQVSISISNHQDIGSKKYAFDYACYRTAGMTGRLLGTINVTNPIWKKSVVRPFNMWSTESNAVKVTISSPSIMNVAGTYLTSTATSSLINTGSRVGSVIVAH